MKWPASGTPAPLPEYWTRVPLFRTRSICGWLQEGRNEHISSPRLAIPGDTCKINSLFTLFPHLPPSPFYISGIQTPIRCCFERFMLRIRIKSYSLPQHFISQSRARLDSVTIGSEDPLMFWLSGHCSWSNVPMLCIPALLKDRSPAAWWH